MKTAIMEQLIYENSVQKVSDILTNKKVSYLDRLNTLVITNELDEVVIILGLTIS